MSNNVIWTIVGILLILVLLLWLFAHLAAR